MKTQNIGFAVLAAAALLAGCASQSPPQAAAGSPPAPAPAVAQAPAPQLTNDELAAVKQDNLTLTFAEGTDRLSPDAIAQLDLAARLFRDVHPVMMYAIGFSDATGDEYGNVLLSARRARAVKDALVARGIPADQLLMQALGESELADPSQPKAAENRRVLVKWRMT